MGRVRGIPARGQLRSAQGDEPADPSASDLHARGLGHRSRPQAVHPLGLDTRVGRTATRRAGCRETITLRSVQPGVRFPRATWPSHSRRIRAVSGEEETSVRSNPRPPQGMRRYRFPTYVAEL